MILDTLNNWSRYAALSAHYPTAFRFLERFTPDVSDGWHELDGNNVRASVQSYTTKPIADVKFEAHRQHIDVQFIYAGRETILWAPLPTLTQVTREYKAETDTTLYAHPREFTSLRLSPGCFAVLHPEDGHAPCAEWDAPGAVTKIVVKVRV